MKKILRRLGDAGAVTASRSHREALATPDMAGVHGVSAMMLNRRRRRRAQSVEESGLTMDGLMALLEEKQTAGQAAATAASQPKLVGYAVANLPAGALGDTAYVTNALLPAFGVAPVGGGGVKVPVFHNGTGWVVG